MFEPLIQIATNLAILLLSSACTNKSGVDARKSDRSLEVTEVSLKSNGTIQSEYTALNSESCKIIELDEETKYSTQACPGYNNIPVFVYQTDDRYTVNIGGTDENEGLGLAFNHLGDKLEWRLQDNEPFAVIYRYYIDGASDKPVGSSVLAVQKVSEKIGRCIAGVVDGSLPNANEAARLFADEKIADFQCGVDKREEVSK